MINQILRGRVILKKGPRATFNRKIALSILGHGTGFNTDTGTLLFHKDGSLYEITGTDVGAAIEQASTGELFVGADEPNTSVIVWNGRLMRFDGTVYANTDSVVFVPNTNAVYSPVNIPAE